MTNSLERFPTYNYAFNPIGYHLNDLIPALNALEGQNVSTGGRIVALRRMGGICFAHIMEDGVRMQLAVRSQFPEAFALLTSLYVGDSIRIQGVVGRNMRGELLVFAEQIDLISSNTMNLNFRYAPEDLDMLRQQRELDLMSHPETMQRFITRSQVIQGIREFMFRYRFHEVETPILQNNPSGATALPFTTHCQATGQDAFLRIAPEIYLMRLINGGFSRIFELSRNFRNEGVSNRHHPEFTMIEFYETFQNYHWAMDFSAELIQQIVSLTHGSLSISYQNQTIDFNSFERLSIPEVLMRYGNFSQEQVNDRSHLIAELNQRRMNCNHDESLGMLQYRLFEAFEEHLVQPTFVLHYPVEISPLAASLPENPNLTERFELFVAGRELGNGFTQLRSATEQEGRFSSQTNLEDGTMRTDHEYIRTLSYGLPAVAGAGIGIDRLVMLLTNTQQIRDIIAFPLI